MGSTLERYADIKLICDKLEKAAIIRGKGGDRTSLKVAALNSVLSLDQIVFASTKALEATQKNLSSQSARNTDEKPQSAEDAWSRWEYSQEPGGEARLCAGKEDEWVASLYTPKVGFSAEINPFNAINRDQQKAIKDLLGLDEEDDLAEGWENCFRCDARVKFDFQLQPVNLLSQIDDILDNIESTIDGWESKASAESYMKRLCELFNVFREVIFVKDGSLKVTICVQDWIAMLLGLQGLMAKYANLSISISLDWTVLFGPLLKLIIDSVAGLIEQITQLLTAPLDCAIGVLTTVEELYNELNDTITIAKAAVDVAIPNPEGKIDFGIAGQWEGDGRKMEVGWRADTNIGGINVNGEEQGIIPDADLNYQPSRTVPPELFVNKKDLDKGLFNVNGDGVSEVPIGFNIRGYNGLEEAALDPNFNQATFLQNIIISLKGARRWLTELFSNIIFTLKSLNQLVSGGIGLNLQNIGFMMLILDIINSIKFIMAFENGLEPCEEDYEELIKRMKKSNSDFDYTVTPESNIEITDQHGQTMVIDPSKCKGYIRDAPTLNPEQKTPRQYID